jgi:CheY-like chemotaxis protein
MSRERDDAAAWVAAQRYAQEIVGATARADVGRALAAASANAIGAEAACVALIEGGTLRVEAIAGDATLVRPIGSALDDAAERWSIARGEAAWVAGGATLSSAREGAGVDAVVAPIGTIGCVVAFVRRPVAAADVAVLGAIANTGRIALEHATEIASGRGLAARTQSLLALQRALAGGLLDDTFVAFSTRLREEVPLDAAWVGRLTPNGDLEVVAVWPAEASLPAPRTQVPIGDSPLGVVLRHGHARTAGPTSLGESAATALAPWASSATVVPLVAHDAVIGVLVALAKASAPASTRTGRIDPNWLFAAVAEPLAMALQNATLFRGQQMIMRDWERTFDVMDALVFVADEHGRVKRINWKLARRLGAAPTKLVGVPVASLFPNQTLPSPKPGVATPIRESIVGPRGEPLRAAAVAFAEGGFVCVLHDVQIASGQSAPSYAALRRLSTPHNPVAARGRVLVVDDEPSILRAVSRTIGRSHEITTATDGDEALALIRGNNGGFDAIITDVQMARIGGIDLYRTVERELPKLAERFVFMTGGVFPAETEIFLRALGGRVLRKPFDPDLLRRVIDERVALSRVA